VKNGFLNQYTKEELIELIELYSKNWLAMDGVWFQAIESKLGMAEAVHFDEKAWSRFTVVEAQKIKEFLKLPANSGIEGLKSALQLRFYANINKAELIVNGKELIYRVLDCRVQNARKRKGLGFHPCKSVGIIEYTGFAKEIDNRFECKPISCYPDITDEGCNCSWKFTLKE
jgi:hypothetical protein